jgi:hypothetical protein
MLNYNFHKLTEKDAYSFIYVLNTVYNVLLYVNGKFKGRAIILSLKGSLPQLD